MNELTLRGEDTFEIKLQRSPTAVGEDGIVIATLLVFAAGFPEATARIEMPLSIQDAEHLYAQLQSALVMARVQAKRR